MATLRRIALAALISTPQVAFAAGDIWNNWTTPIAAMYYSRPDLQPPAMNVSIYNESYLANEYLFFSPYQNLQAAPYIYDKKGNLIWSGYAVSGPFNTHNFHVCSYKGKDHLCMFQGNQHPGYARGRYVILDEDYHIVKDVQSGGDLNPADQHEFRLIDGGASALITIYQNTIYDLTQIGVKTQGWVMDSIFQEVDIETGAVKFEWNALNHVAPWFSYVYPNTSDVSGNGLHYQTPWDYFHINSVDKSTLTGDYLVSGRHVGTVFSINGRDGSIKWRLQAGGDSDFECLDFSFAFQHDAVIRSENTTHMVISMYDNAYNYYNRTTPFSTGKTIVIDYEAKTAYLERPNTQWPWYELSSASQGNSQHLPNGNVFNCYGDLPMFSEHTPDGNAVWAGQIGVTNGAVMTYRAYSFPWKSLPKDTRPALWTFSKDDDALVAAYVSWNGATEVREWAFYGTSDVSQPFQKLGTTDKMGFETMYISDTHYMFMFAEAIGPDGVPLRNSSLVQTFIPSAGLAVNCFDTYCP